MMKVGRAFAQAVTVLAGAVEVVGTVEVAGTDELARPDGTQAG